MIRTLRFGGFNVASDVQTRTKNNPYFSLFTYCLISILVSPSYIFIGVYIKWAFGRLKALYMSFTIGHSFSSYVKSSSSFRFFLWFLSFFPIPVTRKIFHQRRSVFMSASPWTRFRSQHGMLFKFCDGNERCVWGCQVRREMNRISLTINFCNDEIINHRFYDWCVYCTGV